MDKKVTLGALFWAFVRIGALTFGGGYSMLPMLERECVEKTGWVTQDELLEYMAIGQCTPGIIAVNTATFTGNKLRGALGAAVATAGVVLPSLIIITVIAALLSSFLDVPAVRYAFAGIRVAVCALIINAVVKLFRKNVRDIWGIALAVAAFAVVAALGASPVFVVLGAALFGIARMLIENARTGKAGEPR
ncbi:MAG: chromate transporter [Clostridia bacterium]|nr:chromate transporter [Clostridia bacterium]